MGVEKCRSKVNICTSKVNEDTLRWIKGVVEILWLAYCMAKTKALMRWDSSTPIK